MPSSWTPTTYRIVSCIKGEPTEPREVDGQREWASIRAGADALDKFCDLHGYDPDDFELEPVKERS
jgi:hypothetical protein